MKQEPMKYADGSEVRTGDRVQLSNGERGTIVFSIDATEYSEEFPEAQWSYLKKGVMIRTDKGALLHYEDPNVLEVMSVKD